MVNPQRGELQLKLGAENLKCRLSIDGIIRIEQTLGTSIVQIAQRLSEGKATIMEVINVLTPAIKGGGNDITEKRVKEMIWSAGLIEGMRCAGEVLTVALNSGLSSEGNEGAEERKK